MSVESVREEVKFALTRQAESEMAAALGERSSRRPSGRVPAREREVFAGDVRIGPSPFAALLRASRSVTRGAPLRSAMAPQQPKTGRARGAHGYVVYRPPYFLYL